MRSNCVIVAILLILIALPASVSAGVADMKRSSSKVPIDTLGIPSVLYPISSERQTERHKFTSEVQCTVRMVGDSYWAMEGWLVGDEIYKVYQDVDLLPNDCTYPFYVTGIVIELQTTYAGTVYVQVDVEELDPNQSTEGCPFPGALLGISDEFGYVIPAGGYYLLITWFDEPVLVTEPYFAGLYFGSGVYDLNPALILDNDPYLCVSWNDWGEGYVDLISNPYYNFPGNLVMYSLGYNAPEDAGNSTVTLYSPADSSTQFGTVPLFAAERDDTTAYVKCTFEYYSATGWSLIAEDFSADVTLRDGIGPATVNPGYTCNWDLSSLPENWYMVRAKLYRTAEDFTADTIELYVDNTPLKPLMLNPVDGDVVCDTLSVAAYIPDGDVSFLQFELRESEGTIDTPLPLLNQYMYGDVDGDTLDMNPVAQGEFGDFYNGPALITSLLKYFADRGYPDLMMSGTRELSVREMVEAVADSSRVRGRYGSQDDNLLGTLVDHLTSQENRFHVRISDDLNLNDLLFYTAYRGGVVLLGISQPFGHWLAVSELYLPPDVGGSVGCSIYDTRGGTESSSELRLSPTVGITYQGLVRDVDRIVAVYPKADTTAREVIGADLNPSDGWGFFWDASSKPEGDYIIAAVGIDIASHVGEGMAWFTRSCAEPYLIGDADYTGYIDIDDVVYLLQYIFADGPAPQPVVEVGDTDSSGAIDIDDVIYLILYIFADGPPPGE
jgi:hypothetical protein